MKPSTTVARLAAYSSLIALFIMALLPFHAFITVWTSSLIGHYTLLRLWKELILVLLFLAAAWIFLTDKKLQKKLSESKIILLILIYVLLLGVSALVAVLSGSVTVKAAGYGLIVDSRFLIFFFVCLVFATKSTKLQQYWQPVVIIPAMIVSTFAVCQFLVLPNDFLTHFGYGPNTIQAYQTINHDQNYIRVESTLRGSNPLGAYLVLILSVLAVLIIKLRKSRVALIVAFIIALMALAFSFSRSAWIGTTLSMITIIWLSLRSIKLKSIFLAIIAGVGVLMILSLLALRNNTSFENTFFHTNHKSKISESSNEGHLSAFNGAAKDVLHHPIGSGTGTAGPASVYNNDKGKIAENYFLQIGQEVGLIGMGLFIAINIAVGALLWRGRQDSLTLALFASLIGLSFVNLLSHAWADDTISYIWWGLAGLACSTVILGAKSKHYGKEKTSSPS